MTISWRGCRFKNQKHQQISAISAKNANPWTPTTNTISDNPKSTLNLAIKINLTWFLRISTRDFNMRNDLVSPASLNPDTVMVDTKITNLKIKL